MASRYIPLTQQKYCCVPACIQMVMYKNNIPLIDQETIGNALGLIVPEEDAHLFINPHIGDRPIAGWGTQIDKEEFSPNEAFKKLDIPLSMTTTLIDMFTSSEDIEDYLVRHQANDSDILVCYDYGILFGTDSHTGHVNVFDNYDSQSRTVTLVDPEQRVPKYHHVSVDKLFEALAAHGKEKSGGFWQLA